MKDKYIAFPSIRGIEQWENAFYEVQIIRLLKLLNKILKQEDLTHKQQGKLPQSDI